MLGGKAEIETDKGEQEVEPAQIFVEHAAGEFGIPVVEGAEDDEHGAAIDDVVEMAHHEVGVMHVNVEGHLGQGYAGDTTKDKVDDEGAGKQHCRVQGDLAAPKGGKPVEEFDAGRHGNE